MITNVFFTLHSARDRDLLRQHAARLFEHARLDSAFAARQMVAIERLVDFLHAHDVAHPTCQLLLDTDTEGVRFEVLVFDHEAIASGSGGAGSSAHSSSSELAPIGEPALRIPDELQALAGEGATITLERAGPSLVIHLVARPP